MIDSGVEVEGLRKVFRVREPGHWGRGDVVAVEDVSFNVSKGSSLAIVGESGSGKTTTARMIMGLERPTAGRVLIDGKERSLRRLGSKERRRLGRQVQVVFQDPYSSLDPRQRVQDCIEEVLRLHFDLSPRQSKQRVEELLRQVGLDARHAQALPRALSGGQRQRVAIARALAPMPAVLVLDEAVASLDVSIQAQVLNLLADIREQLSVTCLFISHDLAVVRQVSDSVVVMRRGSIVERGATEQVLSSPQQAYTQALLAAVPRPGWKPSRSLQRDTQQVSFEQP